MGVDGGRPPEKLIKEDMFGCRRDPFFSADDVGDLHDVIINDDAQVIRRIPVGFEEHLIIDELVFK